MKEIGEGAACFYTVINIIGTIIISVLCFNHSSESDSDDEITMLLINIIPQVFCIILLIDFCVDDCKCHSVDDFCDCKGEGGGNCNCNCNGGGGGGEVCVALAIIILFIIAMFIIFAIFYGLTKGIGKYASRKCSLGTIFFFETIISIYCIYLYFMDEDGIKYAYIFGVSLGLSVVNFIGLLIPCCRDGCCSAFVSEFCSCCLSQRKSIINQPIIKQNNIIEQNKDLLTNDFDTNPIPISPPSVNSSVEKNYNYNSSIYNNNYIPPINNNFFQDNNNAIDNVTKPNYEIDNDIDRTGSNYDIAPLPYDLPSENEILENYKKYNNSNN